MKSQTQVTLLIDTININYEYIQGTKSKIDPNLQGFLDMIQSENVEIYYFVENNEQNQRLIFEELKYSKTTIMSTLTDETIKLISDREIILVSEDPLGFLHNHPLFIDACFAFYNRTETNVIKKEQIESQFYEYAQEHAGYRKCLHISTLLQLLPYIRDNHQNGICHSKTMVGYHLYPKKLFDLLSQSILFDTTDVLFVPIDLRYFNQAQLKQLNVVMHKNIDFNKGRAELLDAEELKVIDQNFSCLNIIYKDLKIIDRMENIGIIQSRVLFQEVFDEVINQIEAKDFQLCTPQIINFQNSNSEVPDNIQYPIIIKTAAACSAKYSHTMGLVLSQNGLLAALKQECFQSSLIFQQLVKHDGIIFKVYVIGKGIDVQVRGSLPNIEQENFISEDGLFIFDSQQNLLKQFEKCLKTVVQPDLEVSLQLLGRIKTFASELSQFLSKKLNLSLFGYDLILEHGTNKLYIIDINYFPGYKNVKDVGKLFDNLMKG